METTSTSSKVKFALLLVLGLVFVAGSAFAVVGDFVMLRYVPKGVTLLGNGLAGQTEAQLRASIDRDVSSPAKQALAVSGDNRTFTLDPAGIVTVDEDAMVKQAYASVRSATLTARLAAVVTGASWTTEVKPVYSVNNAALASWVSQTASGVDRRPVNAKRTIAHYKIQITPEVLGASVDQTSAVAQLSQALTSDAALSSDHVAALPISTVTPKVVAASFKRAIVVSLSQCKVRLYKGDKLIKTYPCAPGQPAWPTPTGDFKVVRKQANAPWINPGSAWAASMPHSIPGGPGNPMGDRKIGIDYPGVFLHGIPPSEYSSIGTHASHGCMRMMPSAIHDLYPRVRIGDPVYIRS